MELPPDFQVAAEEAISGGVRARCSGHRGSPGLELLWGMAAGFLEESDRQLGGACWLDLGTGSPAAAPIQPACRERPRGIISAMETHGARRRRISARRCGGGSPQARARVWDKVREGGGIRRRGVWRG
jgi:hypothetical protein